MIDPFSPLQIINHKELELRHQVEAAQRAAAEQIDAARSEVAQMVAQADQAGRAEAEAAYQQGLEVVSQEAHQLLAMAQSEAAAWRSLTTQRLDDASNWIMALVLDMAPDRPPEVKPDFEPQQGGDPDAPAHGQSSDYWD